MSSKFEKCFRTTLLVAVFAGQSGCIQKPFEDSQGHIKPHEELAETARNASEIPAPVLDHAFLPPPSQTRPEEVFTVVVHDLPVNELLFALARDAKKNIDITPGISGNVSLNAIDQTFPQILERLKRQIDIRYQMVGDTLVVSPDSPYFVQYDVPYINLTRNNENTVSIATQVASTGSSGDDQQGGSSGGSGGEGSSNSATTVKSVSLHLFWETLIDNVKGILRDQDSIRSGQQIGQGGSSGAMIRTEQSLENSIIANQETGLLAVRATERQHQEIRKYIDNVVERATRQVLIEATIVEVELRDEYRAGIDWDMAFNSSPAVDINSGFGAAAETAISALAASNPVTLAITGSDLAASVKMLDMFGNSRVLSSPKLMVLNNQTAILKVVENLVYFTTEVQTDTTQGVQVTNFETELHTVPVGLVMTVMPHIAENGKIIINARPTISRKVDDVKDPNPQLNGQSLIPVIRVREMESILQINDGDIGVIGGLMENTAEIGNEGTPGLNRIPYLDNLFSFKENITRKKELVVFLRPRIIKTADIGSDLKDFNGYLRNVDEPVKFQIPEL